MAFNYDAFNNADREKAEELYPKVMQALKEWKDKGSNDRGRPAVELFKVSVQFLEVMGLMGPHLKTRQAIIFEATTVAGVIKAVEGK